MSNQLDDFFKNKLQQRTFDYDESAWEDARLLIEADERSKKKRYFFLMFAGLSMLMLVGIAAYYLGKHTAIPTDTPSINSTSKQTNTIDETKLIANSDYNEAILALDEALSTTVDISVPTNDFAESNNSESDKSSAKTINTNSKIKTNKNTKSKTGNKKNSFNLDNAQGVASTTTTIYNSTTIVTDPNLVIIATPKLSENQNDASIVDVQNELTQLPLLHLKFFTESNENSNALIVALPALQKDVEGSPITDSSNKFFFGLRSGVGLIPLKFMDFEVGVELGYQMNRNWSISLQPKYQYQTLAQNTFDKSEINEFGFGLRSSAFNLEAETIRSLHVPIMLSYSFGNQSTNLADPLSSRYLKNKISLGVAYVMLDGVTGTIMQSEAAGESSVYQSGWLAENTFNRHNAELMIGYDRYLSRRFSLGLQARYRVRDQFTDTFTKQNQDILAPNAFYLGLQANFKLF